MDGNIRIPYCVTAQLDEGAVRVAVAQLSTDERRQCERLVRERDRRDFAVAHALLRRSLSACGDRAPHEWTFTPGPRGKPQLPGVAGARDRLSFNLAHTDGLVACGVTRDADIGIDVE